MKKSLEKFFIKLCEFTPLTLTFYEENSKCTKPNEICQYCEKMINKEYSCNKFTTFSNLEFGQMKTF